MKFDIPEGVELPETYKAYTTEADGKRTLDVTGWETPEMVGGLKSSLSSERGHNAEWKKYGTPAEVDAKFADLTEKAKGNGKGADDAQAKLDAMKNEYEGRLTGANDKISKMMQRGASSDMKAELAKAGFIPDAIDDIASSAMGRLQFHDDGTVKVMTSDGKPMIGSGSDHGATLADLAKELATSKSYAVRDAGKGGGGKPAGSQGGTPDKPTVTRAAFDAMSQYERATHAKSGGTVKD